MRCLDGVEAQSRPADEVLVIDNDSSDGTPEMLATRGIRSIRQENVGSAGGWHRAIEAATTGGFDAIWLMDDDGYPDASALAVLTEALTQNVACVSSVVLCEDDPERFVFPFPTLDAKGYPRIFALKRKVVTIGELRGISKSGMYPFVHLFNGALVCMRAVDRIGNVERDYFIFGDEVDFFFRLRQAGGVLSALDAHHYHPDVAKRPYTPEKIYYYVKNTLILNRRYFNHTWLRDPLVLIAALSRTVRRNGIQEGLSYLVGRNLKVLVGAISRGFSGKVGKDFRA